jgi:mono/diheme cytochrome c family protein
MPAWKKTLVEDQIWDLTNYIQSLSVTEKSQDDGVAEQMKALSDEDHGHGGDT